MRLAGKEKGGYYPLPTQMIKLILSAISTNGEAASTRILDPGCGTGAALEALATGMGSTPYGNELHEERSLAAQQLINRTQVINDDFINIKTPKGAFDTLYLNPPYDWDKESGREEYKWLKLTRPMLATGGLLIWVVPERILSDKNVRRYLSSWFDDMTAYRFPGESYDLFKQIIIYGVMREKGQKADTQVLKNLRMLSQLGEALPEHPFFETPLYKPGAAKLSETFWFYGLSPSREAIAAEVAAFGIEQSPIYQRETVPAPRIKLDPLTPMKVGHLASAIAAGHINNKTIEASDGPLLIKGSIYKEEISEAPSVERVGTKIKTKGVTILDPRSVISTVSAKGEIKDLQNSTLAEFLKENISEVTGLLQELYPPRYDFKNSQWNEYMKGVNPRRIPNTNRTGLLPAQKHTAIAACVQHERHRDAIIVGRVGTGKTLMAVAAAYAQHQKEPTKHTHFIVMCPPHLINKWAREVVATWPDAKAMHLDSISAVDKFFATEGPIFGIMKSTTAGRGGGWTHRVWCAGPTSLKSLDSAKQPIKILDAAPKVIAAYKAKKEDVDFFEQMKVMRRLNVMCPTCSAPVTVNDAKNAGANIPATLHDFKAKKMRCEKCDAPLWQDEKGSKKGKYALATYIARHYNEKTHILIVDEAHQYKGEWTDRAIAYGRLVKASVKSIAMTGTVYGGRVSTLFYLLYRLSADFRDSWTDYSKSGRKRLMAKAWAEEYGVVKETTTLSEETSSKSTGTTRATTDRQEAAGSSPAMIPWLLNRSVFVGLHDMGMALPKFQEIVIPVSMNQEMADQYNILYQKLREEVGKRLVRGDRSLLSKYLYALTFWPDSPWRPKVVEDRDGKLIAAIPGTGREVGDHPKEEAIIDLLKDELANGRKCLLMVAQTDTLDIQPQWQDALEKRGIKSAILNVNPYKREKWIAKAESDGVQVIITHPLKVETGLDILSYPTIIWMAPYFSIYTVIQASGRAYRLGQTVDCKVYHFAYEETLQEQALRLVIAKAAAAKRVDGDEIDSDDMADLDALASDSIITSLAKIMSQPITNEARMTEINLAFEQAELGIFEDDFKDCTTYDEAKKLYRKLAKESHPDVAQEANGKVVTTLADLFKEANDEFAKGATYVGGTGIQDEDPDDVEEFVEEAQPEPEPEVFVVEEQEAIVQPIVEIETEKEHTQIVFGEAVIIAKTRRKKSVPELVDVVQLSLF